MKEFIVAGLLISPFVRYALLAGLVLIALRLVFVRLRIYRWFWHPLLVEAALYFWILAALNLLI